MHPASNETMRNFLTAVAPKSGAAWRVLDVGSYDVNGTFRPMVEALGGEYIGIDVVSGPNVDQVVPPYDFPFEDGAFDAVISGSTMEHVQAIWLWFPELARLVRPGGWLAVYTHTSFPEHRFPIDCWRIMPDGMDFLIREVGGWSEWSIVQPNAQDIFATARKQIEQDEVTNE